MTQLFFLLLVTFLQAPQQTSLEAKVSRVTFTYERNGMPVPQYRITVQEDGTGLYEAKVQSRTESMEREAVSEPLHVSGPIVARIFATAHALNHFNTRCASRAKNIASTGAKTISYAGPDGSGSCAYDYTENKQLDALTNTFYGMVTTLDLGRKLDFDHRFDRLGLDADIELLTTAVRDDRATDMGLIAPILRAIADDTQLIQRARYRAAVLLEQTPTR